ncbi:putative reverse transcriptase domain-containing protein, partial [Tanacetum coccineum]
EVKEEYLMIVIADLEVYCVKFRLKSYLLVVLCGYSPTARPYRNKMTKRDLQGFTIGDLEHSLEFVSSDLRLIYEWESDCNTNITGGSTNYKACHNHSLLGNCGSLNKSDVDTRMRTHSVGRLAAESLGGGMGKRVCRGGRGKRHREGNDERVDELNGYVGNQNGNVVNENIQGNVGNVIVNGNWDMSGCSIDQKVKYIAGSFMGKALTWWNSQICTLSREVAVSMSWNDFKFMMIQEFCPSHEMQKLESELWNHAMVGAGHAAYTDRFHELARLVPHLVTPESRMIERYVYGLAPQIRRMVAATKPKTMQKAVQISGALTDEAVRNGTIKKVEKRGNVGEPSKDRNGRDDNKRTRTVNAFATTVNPVGRENTGTWPKCTTCNSYHAPGRPCRTCYNYNRPGHLAKDYRSVPRNVNPVNARNPPVRACYECGLEPSDLGFKYEIKIASGQLVEIDKVIKGCKLEIEGHVFDKYLIPFRHGSFDVIIGMDWLSNNKAKIICHEKVVRIPLPDGNVLRVLGERLKEKVRFLMGIKKQEEIVMVRDFPEVFPDDLSGLPPI